MDPSKLSGNWKKLQATLPRSESTKSSDNVLKRKRSAYGDKLTEKRQRVLKARLPTGIRMSGPKVSVNPTEQSETVVVTKATSAGNKSSPNHINAGLSTEVEVGKYIAIDCEMVGVGPEPDRDSVLARVSIVNYNGDQIYDSYVKPNEEVTDFRTHVSGITEAHMRIARTFKEVQGDVAKVIKDRIVVGHAVRHDFEVLLLDHPKRDVRDTARHAPYRRLAGGGSPRLKILTSELLGLEIQVGEHSSIEDARATMMLFRRDKDAFEREHVKKWPVKVVPQRAQDDEAAARNEKSKKKKKKKKR